MRINKIRVSGFKSFCHPVNLQFKQNGITIIVGPNGCGKSNVVDAIRWVLGEQRVKNLRGSSMEEVIFSGSSFQKPSGMAEVTLTFSNPKGDTLDRFTDYTEIEISRRLYRSGESVYMINKTPVRLKDVRELFMDTGIGGTGYSIIEQGRVGEIVSAKPVERRTLIDDAAGIVKFRFKRETAEKRLDETTQNLLRVNDVLGALAEQEEGLREHVEKAEKYLEINNKSELLEKRHLSLSWHQAGVNEQKTQDLVSSHQQQQQDLQNEKSVVETEMESLKLEQTKREKTLGEQRENLFLKDQNIQNAENKRELENQNLQNVGEQLENFQTELEDQSQRLHDKKKEWSEVETKLSDINKSMVVMESELASIEDNRSEKNIALQKATEEFSTHQKRLLNLHTELTNQTNQKAFLEESLENLSERQNRLQDQEQLHKNQLNEVTLQVTDCEDRLENIVDHKNKLSVKLSELESHSKELNSRIIEKEKHLENLRYQNNTAQSRIESLQQIQSHYEGFKDSVKIFMQLMHDNPEKKRKFGVAGILADYISISSKELENLSQVMAEVLDWIVIERAKLLPQIELFCSENELGQLKFVALDRPASESNTTKISGVSLSNILKFERPLHEWGKKFFSRFYLLEEETNFWKEYENNWPNRPTEILSTSGIRISNDSISMGTVQSGSLGFLQRQQEISDTEKYTFELSEKIKKLELELDSLQKKYSSLKEEQEFNEEEYRKLEFSLLSGNKELEHHQLEERRMQQSVSQISQDSNNILKEINNSSFKESTAESQISSLGNERSELETKTEDLQEQINGLQSKLDSTAEKLLTLRVSLTEATEQQKNLMETNGRLQRDSSETSQRIAQLESAIAESNLKIKNSQKNILSIDQSFEGMLEERSKIKMILDEEILLHEQKNEQQTTLIQKIQERQHLIDNTLTQSHQQSIKLTEFRIQREKFEEQLSEITEQKPEDILAEINIESADHSKMVQELRSLKARLNSMGAVNLAAPEEYEALQERINFLHTQSEDLQKAMEDLKATIKDINIESRRRFKEMFDQVNENFKSVFTTLFEGGEAQLLLTESEDLLSAGIEIMAQPPGKKLQNINLLSGGEKALTAISMLFAIFLVKPSPFCLLDEVDAPLDDVNVVRFNRLIKSLTQNAQFILITHNKKTMETGDILYGVTMEDPGISKTVSVEFQEAGRLIA